MNDYITVCICTYQRNKMLELLLKTLATQKTDTLFTYSIVVVDNYASGNARCTVDRIMKETQLDISYFIEPNQNIAVARNGAVKNAAGNLLAFIDDDEHPAEDWLLQLYKAIMQYSADGVMGPVLPLFEGTPPQWVLKGRFFERPTHPAGHILKWQNTRTGNALIKKALFDEYSLWFDPKFGSGGEDRDFFRRKINEGHIFVWCNAAQVYEHIPCTRWQRKVLLKRALLRGRIALNNRDSKFQSVLFSAIASILYLFGFPIFCLFGHHIFMKYLIKEFDHLGKLLAFIGIDLVKEKYISG